MTTNQPPKRLIINLPKRTCVVCGKQFDVTSKHYTTCSWRCYQVAKAEVERVEAEGKEGAVWPF